MSELSVFDFKNKRLHMVGIGGSSMSGLARMLATEGFSVSGSDSQEGYALEGLRKMGIRVYTGHHPEAVSDADLLI